MDDNTDQYSYYIALRTLPFDHENAGQPSLDCFLEITPELKLKEAAASITLIKDDSDKELQRAKSISSEVFGINLRARFNNLMTCLFHSTCQITEDEMRVLIKTMKKEKLIEARCLL